MQATGLPMLQAGVSLEQEGSDLLLGVPGHTQEASSQAIEQAWGSGAGMNRHYGRGVRRKPGEMNGLETDYANYLTGLQHAGQIISFYFEGIKLRLAPSTFYSPDFLVMMSDQSLEIHEVKGFWEDDARVKIKVAAEKFPFKFKAIKKIKGQWIEEIFE